MSGAMRRIGEYLGLLEDAGYDEYDEETAERQAGPRDAREQRPARPVRAVPSPNVADLEERRRPVAAAPQPVVAELSRITTLHPTTYNEARSVGEEYREGVPVIMNLTEMNDSDAKRLVDFAAGLIFATRGSIERITNKVFLLSPPNVSVAAEDKQRIADGGFFNQS
ncbi:cell division protein SepF [Nocardioides sp. zg-536]|uniref:Cell division protein SepF n=1 Tax=Nocardioides faecalis TaxID=2803858 RepID=A0A938Y269_9ACTN|nr:cell division protein SepF [Nocardioides faecalis]MBM9460486.1 cell division protein SepF [Nocardioides faecalis]MBS4752269.1 cell division protein SepF [Nocardioides faecalis]QVI57577.1 cell division protein SepF [Nocardioides faecalis]